MRWCGEQAFFIADFDNAPQVHDGYACCDMLYNR
jgi:hypothetical protein